MCVWQPRDWLVYTRAGVYLTRDSLYCTFRPISPTAAIAQWARLNGIGRMFESRGGIITFYLFLFTSFSKSFFIVLFATYSVNVNFRDYSYYVDRMNPLFPCDHGAATHSCIMHELGRGTVCKNTAGAQLLHASVICWLQCHDPVVQL